MVSKLCSINACIGPAIESLVIRTLEGGAILNSIADALLVLIPKKVDPGRIGHFRPISLCNDVYKFVTKVIAKRLKNIWGNLISMNQVSFVPDR